MHSYMQGPRVEPRTPHLWPLALLVFWTGFHISIYNELLYISMIQTNFPQSSVGQASINTVKHREVKSVSYLLKSTKVVEALEHFINN